MGVIRHENLSPELRLAALDKVPCLLLEHRVLIGNRNELVVAEALSIRNVRKVWIALLAELADNQWFVELQITQSERIKMTIVTWKRTLFSFKNASGLLLLSM